MLRALDSSSWCFGQVSCLNSLSENQVVVTINQDSAVDLATWLKTNFEDWDRNLAPLARRGLELATGGEYETV